MFTQYKFKSPIEPAVFKAATLETKISYAQDSAKHLKHKFAPSNIVKRLFITLFSWNRINIAMVALLSNQLVM